MLTILIKFSILAVVFGGIYASPHPEFEQTNEMVEFNYGSYERLWCNASGEEPITYKWFTEDADEIFSNYSLNLYSNTTSRGSFLVFDPVTLVPNRTHYSFYCSAANKHGLRNKLFFVEILTNNTRYNETVEPTFDTQYEEVYVRDGDDVSVWCNASGKGEVLYAWFKGDKQFKLRHKGSNVRVHVRYQREGAFLVFDGIKLNDTGIYHCIASNNYGHASKKYYIHVYSNTTNITYDDIEFGLVGVTDTSVTLWVTPLNDTDFVTVKYRDEYESILWSKTFFINNYTNNNFIINNYTNSSEIEISNLIPSGRYTFWLSSNSFSNSSYDSSSLEVVLLPPAPEIIFKAIGGGQIQIEWETGSRWANYNRKTIDKHVLSYRSATNPYTGWQVSNCSIDITIPDCQSYSYTIANLSPKTYYEISLRAHTSAGYGQATKQKMLL